MAFFQPMKVFAISDPHLSFGVPNKSMDRFGAEWVNHPAKIEKNWREIVGEKDVVLVPGDISWAKKLPDVMPDLLWLDKLPGIKVILNGNHDYWWPTATILERELPPSLRFVHNNHVRIGPFLFFGTRLWDTSEYSLFDLIEWDPKKGEIPGLKSGQDLETQEKLYEREIQRLKLSITSIPREDSAIRIALTHYPPLNHTLTPSRVSGTLETAGTKHTVFGHLHSIKKEWIGKAFGKLNGVTYHLTACDYLDFIPKLICEA
jgi:predicted phosphohydrolase